MSKIDGNKINYFIEQNAKKKPQFLSVTDEEWEEALLGYQETISHGADDEMTTAEFWTLIYFSAIGFCKGMEYAQVKAGLKDESNYPRY